MTLRVSDWQPKSDLDSVCNSCDVLNGIKKKRVGLSWIFSTAGTRQYGNWSENIVNSLSTSRVSLTVIFFSWGTNQKRDWERSNIHKTSIKVTRKCNTSLKMPILVIFTQIQFFFLQLLLLAGSYDWVSSLFPRGAKLALKLSSGHHFQPTATLLPYIVYLH